jgi:hypothetical protein
MELAPEGTGYRAKTKKRCYYTYDCRIKSRRRYYDNIGYEFTKDVGKSGDWRGKPC